MAVLKKVAAKKGLPIMLRHSFIILTCLNALLPVSARVPLVCGLDRHFMSQEIPRGHLEALSSKILPSADTLSEPVIVDVMFLYTSKALTGAGTGEKLRRSLMESIDNANYCLTNS